VTFLWGQLGGVPSSDVAPTDWSGSLSSDAEVTIDVRFIIDFEPGQDSLMPVGTPSRAEWVSSTGYDIDGLSFRVSVARDNTGSVAPYLLFATAPITLQLPFYQLEYYAAYYPLGNGQGLAVLARRLWHHPCPAGALRGSWHWQDNTNSNGTFDGLWLDNNGEPIGVYSGRFWTTSDGAREFEGSVSGYITDQVIAEFKGHWRFDDPRVCPTCGDDYGLFCGKIRWLDNSGTGVMRGSFGYLNSEVDAAVLPMIGVWKKICTNAHIHATNPTGD